MGEPTANLGLLVGGEEGLATRIRGSPQRLVTAGRVGADPLADGFHMDAENRSDLPCR